MFKILMFLTSLLSQVPFLVMLFYAEGSWFDEQFLINFIIIFSALEILVSLVVSHFMYI